MFSPVVRWLKSRKSQRLWVWLTLTPPASSLLRLVSLRRCWRWHLHVRGKQPPNWRTVARQLRKTIIIKTIIWSCQFCEDLFFLWRVDEFNFFTTRGGSIRGSFYTSGRKVELSKEYGKLDIGLLLHAECSFMYLRWGKLFLMVGNFSLRSEAYKKPTSKVLLSIFVLLILIRLKTLILISVYHQSESLTKCVTLQFLLWFLLFLSPCLQKDIIITLYFNCENH